ncbi:MAG: asparagine synthase C-terminal domain-containing protein [Methanocellales archaeon]|nr:asparagine synthase C-terminal domain-containing protein [Methanocellales archaeon]MDD3291859.1 asparagine synthase C-terminal domain-containing protein [Methanocellales archaeon]MDD5235502.1 asparagine synthase C-terminal domain-containing protein [Methanocellales archaeon]MDD5485121.1 asparagine synthase C-terminal domain-containing protein [Methanocellales archaeon]
MAKSDGCDIAVCGEGADDIFGGYGQNLRMYINYKNDKPFFKFFLDNYRYFSLEDRSKIIRDKYLVNDFQLLNSFLDEREMPEDIRDKVFYFIQKVHTPGLIIRGANAMRFNDIDMGFPYTDIELVNFVNSLPFDFKVNWKSEKHKKAAKEIYFRDISEKMDIPKYILKKLAERYIPHNVVYRPKYASPLPFDKWFRDLNKWDLDENIFKTKNISAFNGRKKFMIVNPNIFIEVFRKYKHKIK